jgi:hypothetical protein
MMNFMDLETPFQFGFSVYLYSFIILHRTGTVYNDVEELL